MRLARFARKTLTPPFTDFFTDFEKKNRLFCSLARLDCKTVRIFAYSSTLEKSNKRSGTRLKTDFEKKTDCFAVYSALNGNIKHARSIEFDWADILANVTRLCWS